VTQTATSPQRKPLLDEASFQQLLSAAYVLQEHNDRLRAKEVHADFAKNLSAIVETQKLIQTLQLDLEAAAKLVAERVQQITNASGAAIGIIEKGQLVYRGATGSASRDLGTRVVPDAALSADCLSKGNALNYPDAIAGSASRSRLFQEREVKAFIAVPVYHAGQVAGVLELRFARANSFRESDLRTAELMAGLLSEAMVTAARMKWKDALASERQSMLEALERIKPQLERLGTESSIEDLSSGLPATRPHPGAAPKAIPSAAPVAEVCGVCGSNFFSETESFCGICGTARPQAAARSRTSGAGVQDHTAAPWLTPYGAEAPTNGNSHPAAPQGGAGDAASSWPASLQELIELSAAQQDPALSLEKFLEKYGSSRAVPQPVQAASAPAAVEPPAASTTNRSVVGVTAPAPATGSDLGFPPDQFAPPVETHAIVTTGPESLRIVPAEVPVAQSVELQPYPWSSAKKAQHWLETVKGSRTEWLAYQWQRRRANIYIGLAVLILLLVISGWGIRPSTTTMAGNASATVQKQGPPQAHLTMFETLLVNLGLAEAPAAPAYMGNPDTQVWVDVHTALYHCPGSDLYGKTPDGRMATQRDAQQDQFEPANRKACP
jgi:hypothetical protein